MKKSLIALCLLACAASSAMAYPGPDSMGIYAEDDAMGPVATCINIPVFTQQNVYMVLANPSGSQVLAWEATVEHTGQPGLFVGTWTLTAGLNVGTGNNYIVGLGASPLVPNAAGVVTLMSMEVLLLADVPVEFFIKPVAGSTSFADTPGYQAVLGVMSPCVTSTGTTAGVYDIPVFRVNGNCVVANEGRTWGSVKTLY